MSPPRILIVDDQPLLCEYMLASAEDAGWAAQYVTDAAAFEEALKNNHPAALALDLSMPGRDGVELLRYLATVGYQGKLLIVSGCDQAVIASSGLLARHHGLDVVGCYQKPISAPTFAALLRSIAVLL